MIKFFQITAGMTAFLFFIFQSSLATFAGQESLSVEKAYEIALESSPVLQEARASDEKADAGVSRALSAFLPRVDLELGYSHSNKPPQVFTDKLNQQDFKESDFAIDRLNDPGFRDNWGARLVFTQPIFNQGREYINYSLSRIAKELTSIRLQGDTQKVLFMVEQAFYQTIMADEKVNVLQKALESADANEKLTKARLDNGMALKSDLLNAVVHKTETQRELIEAENEYKISMAFLNKTMGASMDKIWKLETPVNSMGERELDLQYWINLAKSNRPEIKAAHKEFEMAAKKTSKARMRYMPSINLHAIYDNNRHNLAYSGGDDWTVMASASINLFNGLGDSAAVSEAIAMEKKAEAAAKKIEDEVLLSVRQAFYNMERARKQLSVMKKSVEQAQESMRIISRRYGNGLALVVELLSSDTVLKNERLREAMAKFDLRLSCARLKWSTGTLIEEFKNSMKMRTVSE